MLELKDDEDDFESIKAYETAPIMITMMTIATTRTVEIANVFDCCPTTDYKHIEISNKDLPRLLDYV